MAEIMTVEEIRHRVIPVLERHDIKKAALFGSFVRDEASIGSDVDILVEIDSDIGLLDFVGIKLELEEALGRKVDLVEYDTIKPIIKKRILSEQIAIL